MKHKTHWQRSCLALAWSSALLSLSLQAATAPAAPTGVDQAAASLSLERLFRAESYRGENAKEMAFSHSGRYLAYLWNPFDRPGADLHVHDTRSGKTLRISSIELMAGHDAPEDLERYARKAQQRREELAERQAREEAQQAYLRGEPVELKQWENAAIAKLKLEQAEKKRKDEARQAEEKAEAEAEKKAAEALAARRAAAGTPAASAAAASAAPAPAAAASAAAVQEKDKEDWEWRDELRKQREKNKLKPEDQYPGVSQVVWANERDELIFQYRGRLFRWQPGQRGFSPLLHTGRDLRILAYTPDDRGYLFMDETRVLRAEFSGGGAQWINRELIHPDDAERKYRISATTFSENGRWMALTAEAPLLGPDGKPLPPKPARQVEYMSYSERFASVKRTDREVSDDRHTQLPTAVYVREITVKNSEQGLASQRQPEPVYSHAGGDTWFEISPVAWSRTGSHYAFATWEREKELLRVYLGQPDGKNKARLVLERRGDVHPELYAALNPQFTPDGKQLLIHLAEQGFRQPYLLDLASRALRPMLQAQNFEAYELLGFTPDSRQALISANRDDRAAMNVFRVDLASGQLTPLGERQDVHRKAVASWGGEWVAANAGHWGARPELKLIQAQGQAQLGRVLTDSHDKTWNEVALLQPERFSIQNRHGDTLEGYVFKPPGWKASDQRPAVVYVYGGPLGDSHIVERDSFQPTAYQFGLYMAAKHGYVMLTIDPRGHSNYGQRFASANFERPGQPQTEDLEDTLKYMGANLGIDPARVGLNGWSFGGYQTQFTMYTRPDLFAAGIAGAGPTEWENYNSWYSGLAIGRVDRSKPVLRKFSLLPLAAGLRKPLMLVHGMQDSNVLYQDTVNVYRALLDSGKDALVELYLDPDGHHGMAGTVKAAGWHRKYEAFWLQHLGRVQAN